MQAGANSSPSPSETHHSTSKAARAVRPSAASRSASLVASVLASLGCGVPSWAYRSAGAQAQPG